MCQTFLSSTRFLRFFVFSEFDFICSLVMFTLIPDVISNMDDLIYLNDLGVVSNA